VTPKLSGRSQALWVGGLLDYTSMEPKQNKLLNNCRPVCLLISFSFLVFSFFLSLTFLFFFSYAVSLPCSTSDLMSLLYFQPTFLILKNKVGLWDHVAVCVCVSVYPPIVARQCLGKNPFFVARQRLGKYPLIFARQRLGRNVTALTNTHAIIEQLLDASFSMWPVSYQGR
jgi:hypothetical protein